MSVVVDVRGHTDDEREPTWDEAVAAFEAATPVELVRPPRQIAVIYRYAGGHFTATSPDLAGFGISGPSLHETRQLVTQDLVGFLDPAIGIEERYPAPEPEIVSTAASRSWIKADSLQGIIVSSCSAGRAFVSSARAARRVSA